MRGTRLFECEMLLWRRHCGCGFNAVVVELPPRGAQAVVGAFQAAAEQRRASILADEAVGPLAPPPGPELGVNAGMHQARRYALHRRITTDD